MTAHEGNIYFFPEGADIEYFVIEHKQHKRQLLNFLGLKSDARLKCVPVGQQISRCKPAGEHLILTIHVISI